MAVSALVTGLINAITQHSDWICEILNNGILEQVTIDTLTISIFKSVCLFGHM